MIHDSHRRFMNVMRRQKLVSSIFRIKFQESETRPRTFPSQQFIFIMNDVTKMSIEYPLSMAKNWGGKKVSVYKTFKLLTQLVNTQLPAHSRYTG